MLISILNPTLHQWACCLVSRLLDFFFPWASRPRILQNQNFGSHSTSWVFHIAFLHLTTTMLWVQTQTSGVVFELFCHQWQYRDVILNVILGWFSCLPIPQLLNPEISDNSESLCCSSAPLGGGFSKGSLLNPTVNWLVCCINPSRRTLSAYPEVFYISSWQWIHE